jgi:hypothetical protein
MKTRLLSTTTRRIRLISLLVLVLTLTYSSTWADPDPGLEWVDFFSANTTFFGEPVPVGAVVAAFDPQGVKCGERTVVEKGKYGLLPCYRDDATTPEDDGASPGDVISFTINGLPVTAAGPDDPIWTSYGDKWEVDLWMPQRLIVSKAGSETGTVISDPVGIHCGVDCTENYDYDTVVTLTAYPDVQSYLVGWSGGCSGTEHTTTVIMDTDKTCTATFGWPVGGIVVPVNRLELLSPWLSLAALASLAALTVALVRRHKL